MTLKVRRSMGVCMLKQRNVLGRSVIVSVILAVMCFVSISAWAKQAPPTGSKLYSVTLATEDAGGGALTFTLTFTNLPKSSAVIGSINVTVPSGFTGISTPTISAISPGRVWTATKPASPGNLIKLRASSDKQKLTPGQFVSVRFTATPPTGEGSYVFVTGAKSSRDFSGSPLFVQVGFNPVLVVCPSSGDCTAELGDTSDAQPGGQSGSITLTDDCGGCILTINSTPGDFCSTSPNPPNTPCRSLLVPQFLVDGSYEGDATFVLTCDFHDCPFIPEPPVCTGCSSESSADFYPVFFTDSNAPTTTGQTVQELDFCDYYYPVAPCIQSQYRLTEGSGDLTSSILLNFSCGCETFASDPRGGY